MGVWPSTGRLAAAARVAIALVSVRGCFMVCVSRKPRRAAGFTRHARTGPFPSVHMGQHEFTPGEQELLGVRGVGLRTCRPWEGAVTVALRLRDSVVETRRRRKALGSRGGHRKRAERRDECRSILDRFRIWNRAPVIMPIATEGRSSWMFSRGGGPSRLRTTTVSVGVCSRRSRIVASRHTV